MYVILAGESPVVAVIGTGGGKSLLFMLSAFCSGGGVNVVVIPLIALRQDI
jgi:superfamily II DNA helicase RecQ